MSQFIKDILRDKGSVKFSITKVISFIMFLFFILYLVVYLLFYKKPVDHTLVIELIGFMLTLLGFKNGWGIKNTKPPTNPSSDIKFDSKSDTTNKDEGVF